MTNLKTINRASMAMLIAGVTYLLLEYVVAKAWVNPTYDWANNYVPDLGNSANGLYLNRTVFSPLYFLMNIGFIIESVLFGGATVMLSKLFEGKTRKAMFTFGLVHAAGLIVFAIFHQEPIIAENYTRLIINIVSGGLGILAGNIIVIIAGSQWKRLSLPSWYGWISIILNIGSIIFVFAFFGNDDVPGGIRERLSIYSFVFWQISTGIFLLSINYKKKKEYLEGNDFNSRNDLKSLFTATEIVLPNIVEPDGLLIQERNLANPNTDEVILKMEATGISFAEKSMRRDQYPGMPKFPFVPGYDLVGTVVAVGDKAASALIGKRFAVLTLTGGWATYTTVKTENLLPVPEEINAIEAEALIVNGITAWQMLHRDAKVKKGDTILVHGANGGVGTILTQLAQIAGVRVIGASSPKHHEALQKKGIIPVDYNDINLAQTVRTISPDGVDAVFDNIGGKSIDVSFKLLKKGGTMVSYAMISKSSSNTIRMAQFIFMICKVLLLNILPNGKNTAFYYIWSGKGTEEFRTKMKADFANLMYLVKQKKLNPQIASTFQLTDITKAMEFAESRNVFGKVILVA